MYSRPIWYGYHQRDIAIPYQLSQAKEAVVAVPVKSPIKPPLALILPSTVSFSGGAVAGIPLPEETELGCPTVLEGLSIVPGGVAASLSFSV